MGNEVQAEAEVTEPFFIGFMNSTSDMATTALDEVFELPVLGARRTSNFIFAVLATIGGFGFSMTSLSSRIGKEILPMLPGYELNWIPQGLVMGLYGIAALLLSCYLWAVIFVDLGGGTNRFDKTSGVASFTRNGFRRKIDVDVPLNDIQSVKVEVREGISPLRRLSLNIKGRRDLPLTQVGEPMPLADLELKGAKLARFLGVPLEGL